MNVANFYRKIKQILDDSNVALVNKGLSKVNSLSEVAVEIGKIENSINKLPYLLSPMTNFQINEYDLKDADKIAVMAFSGIHSISKVIIPNNITAIESQAFRNCTSLKEVVICNSVTTIGLAAFLECNNLTDIYLHSTIPPSLGEYAIPSTTIIHVPIGSKNAYESATNWAVYASKIIEDIDIE